MKQKLLSFAILNLFTLFFMQSFSQNVGIGTLTPVTKLTVQTSTDNFGITHTDGTVRVGTYVGSSGGWLATQSLSPLYFGTGLLNGNNSAQMTLLTNGNFGIGTLNPNVRLTVQTGSDNYGIVHTDGTVTLGTYIGAGLGWFGTKSNHALAFFTNNSLPLMTLTTSGQLGVGTQTPWSKLTVKTGDGGYGFSHVSVSGNILATLVGTTSAGIGTFSPGTDMKLYCGGNSAVFINASNRNVGIDVDNPTNKLQIGYMGATGFNGNQLAIGNGTNALGIAQTNTITQFASSTNIVFLPNANNGQGNVGINTSSPRCPLEVGGNVSLPSQNPYSDFAYFTVGHTSSYQTVPVEGGVTSSTIPNVSIIASNRILATEFDAYSDARIKDITGLSNNAKDLETLNALQITDYTMKDKVQHGNKAYKKIIAQQVENVYPQVVSKHSDFIPNVYQLATKVEKTADGYTINFGNNHNLSPTAKKIRVILPEGGMKEMNVVSIPSETQIVVNGIDIKGDKLFVYGEEVDDFRTVDYEGLTTLNISATQELSKLIDALNEKIVLLEKRLEELETKK